MQFKSNCRVHLFCLLLYFLTFFLTTAAVWNEEKPISSVGQFIPHRYNRFIFFFLSENVTLTFFTETIVKKLSEFDSYCSGENFHTKIIAGNLHDDGCRFSSFEDCIYYHYYHWPPGSWFQYNRAENVTAGSVDNRDVNNVSAILLGETNNILEFAVYQPIPVITQIILVTDYVVESLKNDNITRSLLDLKSKTNGTFIALTTNVTDKIANQYFRNDTWITVTDYTAWMPESAKKNPICNDKMQNNSMANSFFNGDFKLNLFLLFSSDYIKKTQLTEVIDLLSNMTVRRWQYPCRQFRSVGYFYGIKVVPYDQVHCFLEDPIERVNDPSICNVYSLRLSFASNVDATNSTQDCGRQGADGGFAKFFYDFLQQAEQDHLNGKQKFLLISDLPMPSSCRRQSPYVFDLLNNFTDYFSGAPLTVIAIDKENDHSVSKSYEPLFPSTQLPNLHKVYSIAELLPNINTTVNFCLDFVPLLLVQSIPYIKVVWYFYVIGVLILIALIAVLTYLVIRRQKLRREKLKHISEGMQTLPLPKRVKENQYHDDKKAATADSWEVSLKSLDIDFKNSLGEGAFSIVYSGFLHGKAPVLNIFPSIARQQFTDCDVAVKTLPQHSTEGAKTTFRSEVELMKKIGYSTHLVSMLGCNISIERPILIMELAEQDLLHWLISSGASTSENESNQEKTLLSICWQISDGMSYLSSRRFVHRDVAARNVLLNAEMKAMVSDFGLCQKLEADEVFLVIPGGKLPSKWMAPESLEEHKFSLDTDVVQKHITSGQISMYEEIRRKIRLKLKQGNLERKILICFENILCFPTIDYSLHCCLISTMKMSTPKITGHKLVASSSMKRSRRNCENIRDHFDDKQCAQCFD